MPQQKFIIYTRVSGEADQRTASLDSQEESCRLFAAKHNAEVIEVVAERFTGAEFWERPKLTEARKKLRDGRVNGIICHAVDRLTRDPLHLAFR